MALSAPAHWPHLLRSACQRNAAVDLVPLESLADEPMLIERSDNHFEATERPTWRVRMLSLERDALIVERPRIAGAPVSIAPGTMVEGVITDGSRRWSFISRVIDQVRQSLNGEQVVAGVRLSIPTRVQESQRRDYYRVSVAGIDLPPVKMSVLHDSDAVLAYQKYNRLIHRLAGRTSGMKVVVPALPATGEAMTATAIDVSGGGLCLAAESSAEAMLVALPQLWVEFNVPGAFGPIFSSARPAHWHHDGRRLVVGLCFNFDRDRDHADFIGDIVCRFAAEQQRKLLRKR
jgi:hypothetical protein